jgi:hypothetical protein
MFSEMLLNSNETIFLQAVDEFFNISPQINVKSNTNNNLNEENVNSSDLQGYVEQMNIKFYESLDDFEPDIKDASTVGDFDDSVNSEGLFKETIMVNDFIIVNEKSLSNILNKKIHYDQIEFCRCFTNRKYKNLNVFQAYRLYIYEKQLNKTVFTIDY